MAVLTVPPLSLNYDPIEDGLATLEKTLEVRCGNVTFSDGASFTQTQQKVAGLLVYRKLSSVIEVWNEIVQQWEPDPGESIEALSPKPFAFKSALSEPWQVLLVPAAEKSPPFERASTGFSYLFRAVFISNHKIGAIAGLSAFSTPIQFSGLVETIKAGIKTTPEEIKTASEIELFLRDDRRQIIGFVKVSSSGGSAQIEIGNRDAIGTPRAVVQLLPDGDIVLRPFKDKRVRIEGLLETEKILYQPSIGIENSKKYLS